MRALRKNQNVLSLGQCDNKLVSERVGVGGVDIKGDRRIRVLSKKESQQGNRQD